MGTVNLLLFQSKDQLVWETFVSMKIEESYRVKKDNVLGFPCCMKNEKYVIRDAEHGSKTRNVEELFDEVDKVISCTVMSILLHVLIGVIVFGIAAPFIVLYADLDQLWLPAVLGNVCIAQPLQVYLWSKRRRGLMSVLENWNNRHGSSQNIQAQLGVENVISWRRFFYAMRAYICTFHPQILFVQSNNSEYSKIDIWMILCIENTSI